MNYYEVLEVWTKACPEVINAAYKALSKKYHPDTTDINKEEALAKMKKINEAHDVLSDPEKRKEYDERFKDGDGKDYIVNDLKAKGAEFADKRANHGALWIIYREDLQEFIKELEGKYNIKFNFSKKGGTASKKRPAWWTQSEK